MRVRNPEGKLETQRGESERVLKRERERERERERDKDKYYTRSELNDKEPNEIMLPVTGRTAL